MNNQTVKTWFVTGASKGLGLALVKQLLAQGQKVAATSRNASDLQKAVGIATLNFLPLEVALNSDTSVKSAIDAAFQNFGSLDVLINNAGYGIGGSFEELTDTEVRNAFDVNVFGTISTIRHALPYMRAQQSGHIINISSIAGFAATTGWAPYAATKFAITGLTEVLAEDVKPFGIKATVVAPGGFRTEFLTQDSIALPENPLPEYTEIREAHSRLMSYDGKQAGDPEKAAEVMIALGFNPNPPVQLFLGTDAYNRASSKIEQLSNDLENNKLTSFSTDFQS
jgi:NAD(P)-dependent dehydrogenase (short-subunit alcohol dehydrogenase family)